jgi:hypothetical protein
MIKRILLAGAALAILAMAGCGGSSKQADTGSAATGDIPDNQVFLTFQDRSAGYAIKYPEGWTRQGAAGSVTFRDKDNFIRVVVGRGGPARKVTYTTQGRPDPVTGKRVTLVVDRYVYARGGRRATVDLGTARGVDNVDAYRLIARSFRWR